MAISSVSLGNLAAPAATCSGLISGTGWVILRVISNSALFSSPSRVERGCSMVWAITSSATPACRACATAARPLRKARTPRNKASPATPVITPSTACLNTASASPSSGSAARYAATGFCKAGTSWITLLRRFSCASKASTSATAPLTTAPPTLEPCTALAAAPTAPGNLLAAPASLPAAPKPTINWLMPSISEPVTVGLLGSSITGKAAAVARLTPWRVACLSLAVPSVVTRGSPTSPCSLSSVTVGNRSDTSCANSARLLTPLATPRATER